MTMEQDRVDKFADATNDHQWIHVDVDRAEKEMPDGKTIAHGYLTLALIPALTGDFVEIKNLERGINLGVNKVRFYTPIQVGDRVRAEGVIDEDDLRRALTADLWKEGGRGSLPGGDHRARRFRPGSYGRSNTAARRYSGPG